MTLKDPYGFIYITTNLKNGKRYIGKKVFDLTSKWKSYLGSGVALKSAIEKYGRENFVKDIIAIAYSEEELCDIEKQYITFFNAVDSLDFYNIAHGGEGYNYFGTRGDTSVSVYCIDLNRAFKNARIAEIYTGENYKTIHTKCKSFKSRSRIRKGYSWCYVYDMYSVLKCSVLSIPVVSLKNNTVYGSWNHANKMLDNCYTRRSIISFDQYIKWENKGKDLEKRLVKLDDYFKIKEFTE